MAFFAPIQLLMPVVRYRNCVCNFPFYSNSVNEMPMKHFFLVNYRPIPKSEIGKNVSIQIHLWHISIMMITGLIDNIHLFQKSIERGKNCDLKFKNVVCYRRLCKEKVLKG